MSDKAREQTNLTPKEIEEFSDTDLPADATVEDTIWAFMKVDPKKVKKAEENTAQRKVWKRRKGE